MRIDGYARLMDDRSQDARLTPATVISDDDGILYLMHEVSRGARRIYDAQVAEIGLNQTQWRIIGQLLRNPSLTQAEIAKALELESASIGQAVVALCDRGLIRRSRAETDGRAWRLELTAELDRASSRFERIRRQSPWFALADYHGRGKAFAARDFDTSGREPRASITLARESFAAPGAAVIILCPASTRESRLYLG